MKRLNVIPYPNGVTFRPGTAVTADVVGNIEEKIHQDLNDEAYILEVRSDGIRIVAGSEKGLFHARKTLEQLVREPEMPCVFIQDEPAYPYRGFMIDPVRHIVSIDDTKKLIDAAAALKMNYMHWHLSDDQGWRIQLKSRPELVEKSSMRKASTFGGEKDFTPYGGCFTREEITDIVSYAAERCIEVIPEIDMPGHMSALLHAHPELSCTGMGSEVITKQGIFPEILCAGKDETFDVIFDILDEMAELFPCRYFHIGGDEAPKTRWHSCPDCRRRMSDEGLKNEEELQGWFTEKVRKHLEEKGKKVIVWNESLKSGLVENVTVQNWMDKEGLCDKYANGGGKVIASDFYHCYCDYPYSMTPLKKCYNYNPCGGKLTDAGKNNIIGVETPMWTEYVKNFTRLCYMWFPRFAAVAENGWSREWAKDEADFERRYKIFEPVLGAMGIIGAPDADWNPSVLSRLPGVWSFFKPTVINMIDEFKG